jgi:hypothetical protein
MIEMSSIRQNSTLYHEREHRIKVTEIMATSAA